MEARREKILLRNYFHKMKGCERNFNFVKKPFYEFKFREWAISMKRNFMKAQQNDLNIRLVRPFILYK